MNTNDLVSDMTHHYIHEAGTGTRCVTSAACLWC